MTATSINQGKIKQAADKTKALLSSLFERHNYVDPGKIRYALRQQYGIYLSDEELFRVLAELVPTHLRIHTTCHGPSPTEIFAFYKPVGAPR